MKRLLNKHQGWGKLYWAEIPVMNPVSKAIDNASMFRAPQWHGTTQTQFPPRPRKSAWHCDITDVVRHTVCPHTEAILAHDTANHPAHQRHAAFTPACFALPSGTAPRKRSFHKGRPNPHGTAASRTYFATRSAHTLEASLSHDTARYRHSSRSPATRRVYASMLRAPQWHGATQTYFPPRLCKSAWHCDITDVIRRTVFPHTRSNPITRYRQSSRSPATRRVYASMFRAPQWHGATQMHCPPRPRKSAWHCDITNVVRHTVCPHTRSNHITLEANTSESSSTTLFPALHLYYKLPSSESSSEKLFPVLHLYYKLATSESSSEKLSPVLHL